MGTEPVLATPLAMQLVLANGTLDVNSTTDNNDRHWNTNALFELSPYTHGL